MWWETRGTAVEAQSERELIGWGNIRIRCGPVWITMRRESQADEETETKIIWMKEKLKHKGGKNPNHQTKQQHFDITCWKQSLPLVSGLLSVGCSSASVTCSPVTHGVAYLHKDPEPEVLLLVIFRSISTATPPTVELMAVCAARPSSVLMAVIVFSSQVCRLEVM